MYFSQIIGRHSRLDVSSFGPFFPVLVVIDADSPVGQSVSSDFWFVWTVCVVSRAGVLR